MEGSSPTNPETNMARMVFHFCTFSIFKMSFLSHIMYQCPIKGSGKNKRLGKFGGVLTPHWRIRLKISKFVRIKNEVSKFENPSSFFHFFVRERYTRLIFQNSGISFNLQ